MRAAVLHGPWDIRVESVPEPVLSGPLDAIVRLTHSCICGSDLWDYRGIAPFSGPRRTGHESMGIVEAVGLDVSSVDVGDLVILPFQLSDGTCPECLSGHPVACRNAVGWGSGGFDGGQGEKVRVAWADVNCFVLPGTRVSEANLPSLLALSDVLGAGHHAAVCAQVGPGRRVAVIGDGAVGLCAVAASRRLGADEIILVSTHPERSEIGLELGATEIVSTRAGAARHAILDLTGGLGADSVLECVGTTAAVTLALGAVRGGGDVGTVGTPHHGGEVAVDELFHRGIGIKGGIAPVASYLPELMADVLDGQIDVGLVFDYTIGLERIAMGYRAMHDRRSVKTLIRH